MSYRIGIEILPPDAGNAAEIADHRRRQYSDVFEHSYQVVGEFDRLEEAEGFVGAVKRAIGGERIMFARTPVRHTETDKALREIAQPAIGMVVPRVLPYEKHFVGAVWTISRWGTLIHRYPFVPADQVQEIVDLLNEAEASVQRGGDPEPKSADSPLI